MSDRSRFERLVLPHLDAAYNFARWLARDPHDAEDIVQDACVRALRYSGSLVGEDGRAWLLGIVRNAFYDWCGRNRRPELASDDATALDEVVDTMTPGPEEAVLRGDAARRLADAVAALPAGFREVLILREIEELSYKQIARVVDIPIGTVMSRLARARGLLQRSPLLRAIAGGAAVGHV